jgi:thiaminase
MASWDWPGSVDATFAPMNPALWESSEMGQQRTHTHHQTTSHWIDQLSAGELHDAYVNVLDEVRVAQSQHDHARLFLYL